MTGMDYDDATAERLEAVYQGPDIVAQRAETLRVLDLKPGEHVLDIGSGPGFLCEEMAEAVGPTGRVRGVDISAAMIRRSEARRTRDWVSYGAGDATALAEPEGAYDAVVSTQVAEYIPDIDSVCRENFRVLKPGGRALVLATDWDALTCHTDDPARMARIMDAFRPHCAHPRLPQILAPHLRAAGFEIDMVSGFPIINIDWRPGLYSFESVPFQASYVRAQGTVPDAELDAWAAEFPRLAAEGRFYYATGRILFLARKPAQGFRR